MAMAQNLSKVFSAQVKHLLGTKGMHAGRQMVNTVFTRYLLITNVSISMTLSGAGDVLQQKYQLSTGKTSQYSVARTANMTATGATVGALCHYWYQLLDKKLPGRTAKVILKKLAVDQILFSPFCIAVFFVTLASSRKLTDSFSSSFKSNSVPLQVTKRTMLTSQDSSVVNNRNQSELEDFVDELSHKGIVLYLSEWLVWPPAQLINFYFLPTRFRVLYDNCVSLFYDVYASRVCFDVKVDEIKALAQSTQGLMSGLDSNANIVEGTSAAISSQDHIKSPPVKYEIEKYNSNLRDLVLYTNIWTR